MNAARIVSVMKRDWRLFWPLATTVGAWQILQRAVAEPDPMGLSNLSVLLSSATGEPLRYAKPGFKNPGFIAEGG